MSGFHSAGSKANHVNPMSILSAAAKICVFWFGRLSGSSSVIRVGCFSVEDLKRNRQFVVRKHDLEDEQCDRGREDRHHQVVLLPIPVDEQGHSRARALQAREADGEAFFGEDIDRPAELQGTKDVAEAWMREIAHAAGMDWWEPEPA